MLQVVGILIAFVLILILVNRKISLGYALILGSLIVAASSGLSFSEVVSTYLQTLIDPVTINLVVVLALIGILGTVMQRLGVLNKIVDSLNSVLRSPKLTISVIPSIMGTLLVTGGAIMAAPLVDEIGDELKLSKAKKAAINLIFRHGWYFVYPFMPAFILMSETASIDKFKLIAVQWPMSLVMLVTGYIMWINPAQDPSKKKQKPTSKDITSMLKYSSPLWVSLGMAIMLEKLISSQVLQKTAFPIALCVGIALAIFIGNRDDNVGRVVKEGIRIPILMSGIGIMVFKSMVGKLTIIGGMIESLMAANVPLALIFIALPLLAGFLSASSSSAIGITLPFLLPAYHMAGSPIPLMMLLYVSAFLGYLVSPLHLCQVLTLEYFDVKMQDLYKQYKIAIPATFIIAILVYLLV